MKYRDEAARRRHRHERIAAVLLVIVLGAALAAFIIWNKADDEKFKRERTYIPPPAKITPEVELLREYLRIDTSNPPGREAAGAAWIVALLARNGVKAEVVEAAPGRPTVYARLAGRRKGEGLLLLQHIDVIPPGEGWSHPPFGAEIALSELYGRGAVDMKGIGLTHLLAFIDVARSGRTPERDLVLLAVSDEERGGGAGMKWIVENRPDLLDGVRYAIGEGGIIEVTADKVTYFGIEIGNKQYVELRVTAASIDALRAARFALARWNVRRQPDGVLPEVRRFFADLAPTRTAFKDDLADIDRSIAVGTYWRLPIPYRQLTQNVVWIHTDRVEGKGAAANVSMLLLPGERPEKWIDWLKKELAPHEVAVADVVSAEPETPISPIGTPLYRLIRREAEQQYRVRAGTMILHRQSNDSRFLRRRGIAAYGVLPFTVTTFQSEAIHGRDERVRLDWFMDGVGLMRRIVRRWAFDGDI